MSTKTTFKRIALVAVAALGLGVMSVAPSQAATSGLAVSVTNGAATTLNSDSSTGALVTLSYLALSGGESLTVSFVQRSALPTGAAITGAGFMWVDSSTATGANLPTFETATSTYFGTKGNGGSSVLRYERTLLTDGSARIKSASTANLFTTATWRVDLGETTTSTIKAGTYGFTAVVREMTSTGAITTITKDFDIVVSAVASQSEEPSAAYSNVYLGAGTTTTPASDSTTINYVATASTTNKAANLRVLINNASNVADTAIDTVTITVSGPGLVYASSAYTKSIKLIGITSGVYPIYADGNAGVSTITVSFEIAKLTFTKSLTFYSAAAKTITAANFNPVLAAGDNDGAIAIVATDANGAPWTGSAYIYASSAADALVAGSTTPVACAAWNSTTGILCPVTAKTIGTAKLKVIDASTVSAANATSNEVTVTVKGTTASSVKIAFDKATYAPNEKAIITVTPLDASGSPLQGKTFSNLLASGGVSSTSAFAAGSETTTYTSITTSAYSSESSNLVAGSRTFVVYMPAASGDVTISATGGTDLPSAAQVKVTATATVVNSSVDAATDAANEATDAANAATDAALAAADAADAATAAAQDASDAVAALSASVSKMISNLRAQITSLTNLVIKIQKKVKA